MANSHLRFRRDVQIAAFTAYVQKMLLEEHKAIDFLENLNHLAVALEIEEPLLTEIVQHQIEILPTIEGNIEEFNKEVIVDSQETSIELYDSKMQVTNDKTLGKVTQEIDLALLKEMNLYDAYRNFTKYYKNGCSADQAKELRQELIDKLMKQIPR